jgi:septal ring factor EnvC (AmiA/AmiB activator)
LPESGAVTTVSVLTPIVNVLGLVAIFYLLKAPIMNTLESLQAKTDELVAKIEESNAKTDALILTANTTKDALVALKGQIPTSPVTEADLQAIITKQQAAIDSLTAQEAQTDAANTAVAP